MRALAVIKMLYHSCDIVIYNKYILGLHPVSGTGLLKPLEFPM